MLLEGSIVDENVELAKMSDGSASRLTTKTRVSYVTGNKERLLPFHLDRSACFFSIP
jgi:hypothetical protein